MNYNYLKHLIKEKKFTLKEVAAGVGFSETGFLRALKNQTLSGSRMIRAAFVAVKW
jgi:hypothetical protein